jgi:hypothetical protein
MKDILEKLSTEKTLVSFFMNSDETSKFTVGYVKQVYDEGVLIFVINP